MIDRLIHLRSGCFQDRHKVCGIEPLADAIHHAIAGPSTRVEFAKWGDSVKESAAYIARRIDPAGRVVLIGYSFGGDAVIDLAWELKKRGVGVADLVLCDAVYRTGILPTWLTANVYSLLPFGKLKIPPNVGRVHRFYQRINIPQGHELKIVDPDRTKVVLDVDLKLRHEQMDESPEFQSEARRVAGLA